MRKPKTLGQLMRRKHILTPFGKAPDGFKRHNFLLLTGNVNTNVWVKTKPSDHRNGTVKAFSF